MIKYELKRYSVEQTIDGAPVAISEARELTDREARLIENAATLLAMCKDLVICVCEGCQDKGNLCDNCLAIKAQSLISDIEGENK